MRARLRKYLPIFFIALLVQILAPIGACWAAAITASDPLSAAEICHNSGLTADQTTGQGGQHSQHGSGCSICRLASVASSIDTPTLVALAAPYRELSRIAWQDQTPKVLAFRVGSNAQARAPPFPS